MVERRARELALKEIESFEKRNKASIPVFLMIEASSSIYLLSNSKDEEYRLGKREFEILEIICTAPVSEKVLASALGLTPSTIKNTKRSIFQKFDLDWTSGSESHQTRLLAKLIKLGILSFEPSVKEDSFSEFAKEK